MRIVGGANRGLKLAEVGAGDAGAHLRPTSDRVREAIFNLLGGGRFGDPVEGARVLDLFAGTGALALEALSRGAAEAVLVEQGRVGQKLIRENLRLMRREGQARLLAVDATRLPPHAGEAFSLAFLDPPYGRGMGQLALGAALAGGWLTPGAVVVWEEAEPQMPLPGTALLDRRSYGGTWITLLGVEP
ncbi:RsmD family RNA methyltransferase [Rubellimicrobium roseum]|uniref:16S rRNA (Guanine(966)-N(2))-methyltransferase RsmD n=1 Tax=Rubellimicrobium roseum TaxID=687525 RepID=A0A5C4NCM3_9RHOB|nr:RsmD family RNA methyltransferase [Rubellimicrobium roseum]TNC71822.1 16S rRNA (guanine(966)-N(2))-methyltransferase RsmD [Rubellimicrobium roseum]